MGLVSRAKMAAADVVARAALRFPPLERGIVAACHHPRLLRLGVGAVATGYPRVLQRRELRVAEMDGYKMYVNVAEALGTEPYFFGRSGTVWLVPKLVRPGDVCIDAGGNAGHYTFQMASRVGPSGRVLTFEANPEFVQMLRRSAALNGFDGRVQVHDVALWSVSGEKMTFHLSENAANSGTSSLVNHGWYLSSETTVQVVTASLDDVLREAKVDHVRLLKIDVERAEDFVLAGARALLAGAMVDVLIVEMHAGAGAQRCLDAAGYRGWLIEPLTESLRSAARVESGVFGDFLYVSPVAASELSAGLGLQ